MFEFAVSSGLVNRALNDIPWCGGIAVRFQLWLLGGSPRTLAPHWGQHVVGAISIVAQEVRHGLYEAGVRGVIADQFVVIENGKFVKRVADCIERSTWFVGADRPPMRDAAQELLTHLRNNGLPRFHPEACIERFELTGDTLVAYVRPYIPTKPDPHWIPAKVLE